MTFRGAGRRCELSLGDAKSSLGDAESSSLGVGQAMCFRKGVHAGVAAVASEYMALHGGDEQGYCREDEARISTAVRDAQAAVHDMFDSLTVVAEKRSASATAAAALSSPPPTSSIRPPSPSPPSSAPPPPSSADEAVEGAVDAEAAKHEVEPMQVRSTTPVCRRWSLQ